MSQFDRVEEMTVERIHPLASREGSPGLAFRLLPFVGKLTKLSIDSSCESFDPNTTSPEMPYALTLLQNGTSLQEYTVPFLNNFWGMKYYSVKLKDQLQYFKMALDIRRRTSISASGEEAKAAQALRTIDLSRIPANVPEFDECGEEWRELVCTMFESAGEGGLQLMGVHEGMWRVLHDDEEDGGREISSKFHMATASRASLEDEMRCLINIDKGQQNVRMKKKEEPDEQKDEPVETKKPKRRRRRVCPIV
jgi:hypothetical protein